MLSEANKFRCGGRFRRLQTGGGFAAESLGDAGADNGGLCRPFPFRYLSHGFRRFAFHFERYSQFVGVFGFRFPSTFRPLLLRWGFRGCVVP